jgi:tetratricopeptide (TPR) repeat protein
MGKRRLLLLITLIVIGLCIWQLPTIIKLIPSRYVAAYFPETFQAIAVREHVEVLPTAVIEIDVQPLLSDIDSRLDTRINTTPFPEQGSNDPNLGLAHLNPQLPRTSGEALESGSTSNGEINPRFDAQSSEANPTPIPVPTLAPISSSGRLTDINHHFQTWNNCGPATLAMGLSHFDLNLTQEDTASFLKPNPEDRNVSPSEMVTFVTQNTDLVALDRANGNLETIRRFVATGIPVIVELGLDPPGEYRWMGWYGHYLLIVAYDDNSEMFWVYDSWFGTSLVPGENVDDRGRQVSYKDLDQYWKQFNRNYIVIYPANREDDVAQIIGPDIDDESMWRQSLLQSQMEVSEEPENAYLWFNLGSNYGALDEHEKAAAAFDKARSIGLPWRMLWYQFGPYEAYFEVGRYEDVILLADTTLQDRPYFEESYYFKGMALAKLGQLTEARSNLERAVRFNSNFLIAQEALEQLDNIELRNGEL